MSDGKQLEALVSFIEERLLPAGFCVNVNKKIRNEEGHQIAEFDVEARGKVGSTDMAWLIECRDRPSSGSAPVSWIEQLYGRRSRFNFNKVTAVSTSGFSPAAIQYAREVGIELREVKELSAQCFDWISVSTMEFCRKHCHLIDIKLYVDEDLSPQLLQELHTKMDDAKGDAEILRSIVTGKYVKASNAFIGAVESFPNIWDKVTPNGNAENVKINAAYPLDDDHYIIDTSMGPVRIREIFFEGELSIQTERLPLQISQYISLENNETISQRASTTFKINDVNHIIAMDKIIKTGETYVTIGTSNNTAEK